MSNSLTGIAVVGWQLLVLSSAAAAAQGNVLFLEVAARSATVEPLRVYAGTKPEFTVTLSAAASVELQLRGDLFAAAQTIAAPVATDMPLAPQRVGPSGAGVQRFTFSLALPATRGSQKFVLRLRARTADDGPWLPLPPVALEAVAATWRQALRQFAERIPSARLGGREEFATFFLAAESNVRLSEAVGDDVRAWFAEEQSVPLAGEMADAVWIIFKPNVPDGMTIKHDAPAPPTILVDSGILTTIDRDPAAQALFERALMTADAVVSTRYRNPR